MAVDLKDVLSPGFKIEDCDGIVVFFDHTEVFGGIWCGRGGRGGGGGGGGGGGVVVVVVVVSLLVLLLVLLYYVLYGFFRNNPVDSGVLKLE